MPLLLVVLRTSPPVSVAGHGRLGPVEAADLAVSKLLAPGPAPPDLASSRRPRGLDQRAELADVVRRQAELYTAPDPSTVGTVRRLAQAIATSIAIHA
ncbi:MAG: hypothetical protein H0T66_00675 [Geodermatophilaceae bacterium]|nr:hypothetical protein [Geodermatophilaceae bacterium]MDQ3457130.1 hypothetical protein [Actinomycetota bacterium]